MSLSCALILLLLATPVWADQSESAEGNRGLNAQWAGQLILDIRLTSFPRLANTNIRVEPFHGHSDYFQARFSILHFLFAKRMQYVIRVNDDPGSKRPRQMQAAPSWRTNLLTFSTTRAAIGFICWASFVTTRAAIAESSSGERISRRLSLATPRGSRTTVCGSINTSQPKRFWKRNATTFRRKRSTQPLALLLTRSAFVSMRDERYPSANASF